MASSGLSEIIMFVAVLLIAAFVVGVLTTSTYKISLNIGKKTDSFSEKLAQDFEIINDPAKIPRDPNLGIITLYIKNTGKKPIIFTPDSFTVIIDGNIVKIYNISQLSNPGSEELYPGDVGELNVSYNESRYHRIKVVLYSGVSRVIEGYIS
ncbi:flagellin [Methanocaldococcus villosus KIN24-T80]|uniref:Flagellin n=1 Tax=Methanocaldococcus villosus KIN24-T80 TaxID=1069083 RepID=N6VXH3_9EURY|nr:flagellin [Methanocaldococcus villosus]ENN95832.1 flagellin [Methanocaldococcus villosus KIN24-T80]